MRNDKNYYDIAVRNLIVKALQELQYEEVISFVHEKNSYRFIVDSNKFYTFEAKLGAWDNIQINQETLKYYVLEIEKSLDIGEFLINISSHANINDETLSQYIEEANQTLFSDVKILKNLDRFESFLNLDFQQVDQILPGHTKLIMNKGRIGFGEEELNNYAPEFGQSFTLHWLAVKNSLLLMGVDEKLDLKSLYTHFFNDAEISEISKKSNFDEFILLPVHPWQWNKYLKIQFYQSILNEEIVDLGERGRKFYPQASLRTLTGVESCAYDVKLALSILNTSCVRGIPHKYIESGQKISSFMEQIVLNDRKLNNVRILKEQAAFAMPHKHFQGIAKGSYRYKEFFGVVFRESVSKVLSAGESAIPTAALVLKNEKNSFIFELIEASKVNTSEWLSLYFHNVVIPLYHLQVKHGVGLVAHGQNTILVLEEGRPSGLIIKDFHGDLRLSESSPYRQHEIGKILEVLPERYLIHDLITGHFITLLRYLSQLLEEKNLITEEEFYQLLGKEVQRYHFELGDSVSEDVNLLKPEFEKVLVNKVRFEMGYSETEQRLKPLLGKNLKNPLVGGIHNE